MLLFVIDTLASSFEDIKKYMNDTIERGKGQWINTINGYRAELGISWEKNERNRQEVTEDEDKRV